MRRRRIALPVALALSLPLMPPASAGATFPAASTAQTNLKPFTQPKTKPVIVRGRNGQVLTINVARNLNPRGARIQVKGNRFDETVGIYLGLCVIPKKGQMPSPCGGGIDQTGSSGASEWISSNPPPYGVTLAMPFRPGGRFSTTITVASRIGSIDCRVTKCAIVVRADHTRNDDRTHDLLIPVTFAKK